jgi:hypothetical protein
MTIWRMRIACRIPKATNTHREHVILIAFQLQQWLQNAPQCYVVRTLLELLVIGKYKQTNKQTGDQIYLHTPHCCTFGPSLNFPMSMYRGYCAILGHLSTTLFHIPQSALTLRRTRELEMWERH